MKATGLLVLLICPALLHAQEAGDGNVTTAILTLERAWFDAESRSDNRGMDRIFDNALVYIENGKLVTKGEYLSRVRSTAGHPQQVVAESATVHVFGTTATVVGTYREINAKDGKTLKRWRYIDTWVNKNGSWMLVAAASSPLPR